MIARCNVQIGVIMRELLKLVLIGIVWGCTMCVLILMIGGLIAGDDFMTKSTMEFTKQAMIHMVIGFTIYFIIAFRLGWIPVNHGLFVVFISISIAFLSGAVIWFCYYLYYKKEAKIINDKINKMES